MRLMMTPLAAAIGLLLLAAPFVSDAQVAGKVPRVGFLAGSTPHPSSRTKAFVTALHDFGYVEGQNVAFEWRASGGRAERVPALALELVRLNVDVIVAVDNPSVAAAQQATKTIPIVMVLATDPVGSGFVVSFARPGGNITGFSGLSEELSRKWLELLREAVPKVSRVAVLTVAQTPAANILWREIQSAAKVLTATLQRHEIAGPDEIDHAFASLIKGRAQGLIVLPHAVTNARRAQIVTLAAEHRLPGMYPDSQYVEAGGLMSYAANFSDLHRRAATFVDKILKGARPADLPVQRPTTFELAINLRTAKRSG